MLVEAVIAEVSYDRAKELGVQWASAARIRASVSSTSTQWQRHR
ncbi:hypothetical protein ULF88_25450 [Halopseudomonas pachastrellae]|nr:hypothetical protein [Halopseudomonas pachastrellae]